ncbi:MAG TPA: entericidin A/B family lipoprotein [Rhodocyclaceae bacterium]|nr:entericidin A/B family lipoprotein [Rhodocyclaceae bacterium]
MTKIGWAAVVLVAGLLAAGCNTVQGLGKDIEKGGEAIQRAVR